MSRAALDFGRGAQGGGGRWGLGIRAARSPPRKSRLVAPARLERGEGGIKDSGAEAAPALQLAGAANFRAAGGPSTPRRLPGSPAPSSAAPFSDGAKPEGTPATHAGEHGGRKPPDPASPLCGGFRSGEPSPSSAVRAGSGAEPRSFPGEAAVSRPAPHCLTLPSPGPLPGWAGGRATGPAPRARKPVPPRNGGGVTRWPCLTRSPPITYTKPPRAV